MLERVCFKKQILNKSNTNLFLFLWFILVYRLALIGLAVDALRDCERMRAINIIDRFVADLFPKRIKYYSFLYP